MIYYKDKEKFDAYKNKLKKCIEEKSSFVDFMHKNENPFCYLFDFMTIDFAYSDYNFQAPYCDEIEEKEIKYVNTFAIKDNNFSRVINSVQYILDGQCKPIELIKFEEGYYIKDGKHRFFAHIILGREKIPASIVVATRK